MSSLFCSSYKKDNNNTFMNLAVLNLYLPTVTQKVSQVRRKPAFCICENKDADQLRGNCEADQRLCFGYIDSTIPLFSKYKISSL